MCGLRKKCTGDIQKYHPLSGVVDPTAGTARGSLRPVRFIQGVNEQISACKRGPLVKPSGTGSGRRLSGTV